MKAIRPKLDKEGNVNISLNPLEYDQFLNQTRSLFEQLLIHLPICKRVETEKQLKNALPFIQEVRELPTYQQLKLSGEIDDSILKRREKEIFGTLNIEQSTKAFKDWMQWQESHSKKKISSDELREYYRGNKNLKP